MSLGLLGQYGSGSESEISDSDDEQFQTYGTTSTNTAEIGKPTGNSDPCAETSPRTATKTCNHGMDIHADPLDQRTYTSHPDSESDSNSSDSATSPDSEGFKSELVPLPLPDLGQKISTSVFSNPYKEAEEARLAILKQHVDFDGPKLTTERRLKKPRRTVQSDSSFRDEGQILSPGDSLFDDRDSSLARTRGKRKHRGGVGNSLMPSKKVVKMHKQMQARERPWTLEN